MTHQKLVIAGVFVALVLTMSTFKTDAAQSSGSEVSAASALQRLIDGNHRFVTGKMEHPRQTTARREEVAKGQHPFATVLACADSRTAPEIVFDQGLGDLFVVRDAGNVLDPIVTESIDYAVQHLHTGLVVVLGHQRCGAVTAAVESHADSETNLGAMLSAIAPAVKAARSMPGNLIDNAIRENVVMVVKQLRSAGPFAAAVKSGKLEIVGAVLSLDSGTVTVVDK